VELATLLAGGEEGPLAGTWNWQIRLQGAEGYVEILP
jgi:hypothetical protein